MTAHGCSMRYEDLVAKATVQGGGVDIGWVAQSFVESGSPNINPEPPREIYGNT